MKLETALLAALFAAAVLISVLTVTSIALDRQPSYVASQQSGQAS